MLPRVLEPEVMDDPAEARDYDAMDHRAVNQCFAADFLAVWGGQNPVLDVGTGTAQIPIELCRQSPTITLVAIDLAEHMLTLARVNVEKAHLTGRIHLEAANARGLGYVNGAFGAVISNSIVHHIPDPAVALAEMVRVLAPGGTLFVRDLARPEDVPTLERLVATYAGDANEHQRQMFTESLHAALTLDEVRGLVSGLGFDPAGATMTSDRHWTWRAVRP
jgi:ubiquinone/menaquinone biosynthesis C-methylase UbiE